MATQYDAMGNVTGQDEEVPAAVANVPSSNQTSHSASRANVRAQFAKALNVSFWEGITKSQQSIVGSRDPKDVLNAFSKVKPEWKGVTDAMLADEGLTKSVHNVLHKDPTMLDGFVDMAEQSGNFKPEEMTAWLGNPRNRRVLQKALDRIAEDDKLTSKDFKELIENRNNQGKTIAKLNEMGISTFDLMSGQDMLSMLKSFLENPMEFLKMLPEMLGAGPIQADAIRNNGLFKFATNYAGVVLGGEGGGYGKLLSDGITNAQNYYGSGRMEKDIDDLSGKSDEKAAKNKTAGLEGDKSNVVASIKPRDHFDLARHGIVPTVSQKQEQNVAAYDAKQPDHIRSNNFGPAYT